MELFKTYKLWDIEPVKGLDTTLWDDKGQVYTDLYGGHAVISVGHCHPHYVEMMTAQLNKLGFYSNAVQNSIQKELASRLGQVSGYTEHSLFLCNSGAEANENAFKVASFHTGRPKILAFSKAFHGRTSGAVSATDNPKIQAPFNKNSNVTFVPLNDIEAVEKELASGQYAGVIIEGIQGVAGIYEPTDNFLRSLRDLCDKFGTMLILDEIQSGYGRTGKFFAHQHAGIEADIITTAKGMANGFPIGGVIISPKVKAEYGMLGTTFGGNHLAMAAAIATIQIITSEKLIDNALKVGNHLLETIPRHTSVKDVRGRGLMIGIEMEEPVSSIRSSLLYDKHIFTGVAGRNMIRLLPPLCLTVQQADIFTNAFNELLK